MPEVRSSNLRVKKQFTDLERDRFLAEAFEFMANYFEGSLEELKARNPELEASFRQIDANTFTAAIYRNGSKVTSCRVRLSKMWKTGGITYSASDSGDGASFNNMLVVTDDGYTMALTSQFGTLPQYQTQRNELTQQGGAELFWSLLLDPLQR